MNKKFEITAPVGSKEALIAAINAKTDSIYFGINKLNMRKQASSNIALDDLEEISNLCQKNSIKSYLTLNSIIYDSEIELVKEIVDRAKRAGISAIIAHDISVISYARSQKMVIHISTQANVSNIEAVKYYSQFADVIVLARELDLNQIRAITDAIEKEKIKGPSNNLLKIEIFIHGALCVAISGKCYMSLAQYNTSANRGACLQVCRRQYKVIEEETGQELLIDNKFIMSPKDLCMIEHMDELINSGVSIFKIEGRGRPAEYVHAVVSCYREAINSVLEKSYTKEKIENWKKELKKVYNRDFWHGGYYLGNKLGEWSGKYGSHATTKKTYIGKCTNYFSKTNIGEFLIHSDKIQVGDEIIITGPSTGLIQIKVSSLQTHTNNNIAQKGDLVTIALERKIRKNDKLYLVEKA